MTKIVVTLRKKALSNFESLTKLKKKKPAQINEQAFY
jgi:hypothetical protein